jgi:predicted AlkP superfamily pyrophosphatase or phosphodiesterase
MKKAIVIQVAALGEQLLRQRGMAELCGLPLRATAAAFPAVTCTAQAALRTASSVAVHGMVGNGFMQRELAKPMFWEQSSALVEGERIWDRFRAAGGRVGMLFWQQSLGESVDMVLSPAPIHRHHGGMIQDCYCQPSMLYADVVAAVGRPFDLKHYWGPLASPKASQWVAEATAYILSRADAPELLFTYLPGLDYDLQRFGPDHPRSQRALDTQLKQLALVVAAARAKEYEVLVVGDYAIEACDTPLFPNRRLHEAGLLQCREVKGMLYPDFHTSRAVAVVDHQVAQLYVRAEQDLAAVRDLLLGMEGVDEVLDRAAQAARGVQHPRGGELLAISAPGCWWAYPWWSARREAPDYATHVDIHNKPGYDPAELFFGRPPWQVSLDASRIRGSHGRVGEGMQVAWSASMLDGAPADLIELSLMFANWLDLE